jgi:polysaccharide export outer membrane protein
MLRPPPFPHVLHNPPRMTRFSHAVLYLALLLAVPAVARSQARPTPAQAQAALNDPALVARIRREILSSGMTAEQVRARLTAEGYSPSMLDAVLAGTTSDTTRLSDDAFAAIRALGLVDAAVLDSLRPSRRPPTVAGGAEPAEPSLRLFGREVFDRTTGQFDPVANGPVPPDYRIGVGDRLMLVLTGDIEKTEELVVTREGWAVLKDVGQIPVANLTLEQLRSMLTQRLGQVYSGIRTGTTKFSVLPMRLGTSQVYVYGEVRSPNAYQISRLGTVLTALYAAGGPSENGDARSVEVRRSNRLVATVDLYDYLLSGTSSSDIRLENGDVVFVRPRGPRVRVTGAVVRPATYELKQGESLADAIRMAGGFLPDADRRRVQIERIVPPARRSAAGSDKEVLDITSPALATGFGPTTQQLEPGDVVIVFSVDPRVANKITVSGNVWAPTTVALTPGMRVSDALAKASGLKPDTYQGALHISRLQADSTRRLIRVPLDTNFRPVDDIALTPDDQIRAFSLTEYRTQRYVTVGGAVHLPRDILYQDGMTLRDAVMLAGGLLESALLTEAEVASLPQDRANRVTATTRRVPLDSTYLFERGPDGKYVGPPGVQVPSARTPDVFLKPYDAVTILQQPEFSYQRTVAITGEVKFPGQYALKTKNERLSDILVRAGGITADAYPAGIVFTRARTGRVADEKTSGRIGIDLPRVLRDPEHLDNLLLVSGDSIFIPPYSPIVTVRGAVNTPEISVAYVRGADIGYYVRAAGGRTTKADEGRAYVLQPNGKVETKHKNLFVFPADLKPEAGSVVVVPEKEAGDKRDWVGIVQTSLSLLASLVTVAVLVRNP